MSQPGFEVTAIVLAAGRSRWVTPDQVWADLNGRPLLAHSLDAIARSGAVGWIVLVVAPDRLAEARGMTLADRVLVATAGRRAALAAGAAALPPSAIWVLLHDAAWPFLTQEVIRATLAAARLTGAAVATAPVTDTIKVVRDQQVVGTLPRDRLRALRTPLVVRRDLLEGALATLQDEFDDEWTLAERLDRLAVTAGGELGSLRVAEPADVDFARALLAARTIGT